MCLVEVVGLSNWWQKVNRRRSRHILGEKLLEKQNSKSLLLLVKSVQVSRDLVALTGSCVILEYMEQTCQDPSCCNKTILYQYTVAPGVYLKLCKACLQLRGYYATCKRPSFLMSVK